MTATAAQIAAALRRNLPGLTPGRVHKLLYLAQGHHLAWHGEPLFGDTVAVWDTGVVVPALRGRELDEATGDGRLGGPARNTVGYVCSRYGKLHLHDLTLLTTHSTPAVAADEGRRPGIAVPVDHDAMATYFRTVDVDPDAPIITAAQIARHVAAFEANRDRPAKPDDMDAIRAWAAGLHAAAAPQSA